ncbi:fimbrial protein [Photorhabdus heterorhabditis]|uniref:Fimbrial protein n=1 Tax=Photorhabdus heterorhabditis TaxID=880156 RepID=A0ABR5KC37_9GAMM|nr:fimbrial protein [Photorhabdus heterorhabditis]KOY61932.1 fimbrial protein [Photorhabdus heterorhabditis]
MKLKLLYLSALISLNSSIVYANCQPSVAITAPAINIDMTDHLYLNSNASWQLNTRYSDYFKCTSNALWKQNSVANGSPFTKNKVVLGFNGGKNYVEVTITNLSPSSNIYLGNSNTTYPASKLQAQFTLNVKLLNGRPGGSNIHVFSGNTATLKTAVIAMDTTNIGLFDAILRFATDFLTFILTWVWPTHSEDIYYQPVTMIFNRQDTTCHFSNAGLTVNLPKVNRATLLSGTNKGETPFTLNFECNFLLNGKTSRSVKAYLSSNNLLPNDNRTLIDNKAGAAKGVGIRVSQPGSSTPITFSTSQTSSQGATPLFSKNTDNAMDKRFAIDLNAYYYVYDPKNIMSGELKATSVLNFEYN